MSITRMLSRKEKAEKLISKWAFAILFGLCIQFLVYIVILNLTPTMVNKKNATEEDFITAEINSIDYEDDSVASLNSFYITDNYYTTNGFFKTSIENPTLFIYYYNMLLLLATILLILYYFVNFMENNDGHVLEKIKKFLKEQWPFALLLIFMAWVFISSLLARDSYRSFIGCFNLKDGYFSFMMYGSMLICSMLLVKNDEKYKKIIVNTFLITATILAIITLWNYFYLNSDNYEYYPWYSLKEGALDDGSVSVSDINVEYLITYGKDTKKTVVTLGELLFGNGGLPIGENFLIVTKRVLGETNSGIFHNSNHYGYYLSICVIVAAVMAMKEKKHWLSSLYLVSYAIMLEMAIINNTLGSYLGIVFSIIFMLVYSLIPKNDKTIWRAECIKTLVIVSILIIFSCYTTNTNGKNIVYENLSTLANDFNILVSGNKNDSDAENSENLEASETSNKEDEIASNIGSGRGELWEKAAIMALQKPLFGYGLENILYEYNEQFDISEGRSHSLVFQLAATTGIVGMLLYVVGIAAIWIRKLKYIKEWDIYESIGMFVIVSYIISSLFGNSGFYTSGYFYIFVGFVAISAKKELVDANKKSKGNTLVTIKNNKKDKYI